MDPLGIQGWAQRPGRLSLRQALPGTHGWSLVFSEGGIWFLSEMPAIEHFVMSKFNFLSKTSLASCKEFAFLITITSCGALFFVFFLLSSKDPS